MDSKELLNPLYELVPISEKPQNNGRYTLLNESIPEVDNLLFLDDRMKSGWQFADNDITDIVESKFTHWLRPIDPETLKAMIREELEKAYDAGFDYDVKLMGGGNETPDRETYINSVIDKLFK